MKPLVYKENTHEYIYLETKGIEQGMFAVYREDNVMVMFISTSKSFEELLEDIIQDYTLPEEERVGGAEVTIQESVRCLLDYWDKVRPEYLDIVKGTTSSYYYVDFEKAKGIPIKRERNVAFVGDTETVVDFSDLVKKLDQNEGYGYFLVQENIDKGITMLTKRILVEVNLDEIKEAVLNESTALFEMMNKVIIL